jgi:hypothetical protein
MGFFAEYFLARAAYDVAVHDPERRSRARAARENGPRGDEVALNPGTAQYARVAQCVSADALALGTRLRDLNAWLARADRDRSYDDTVRSDLARLKADRATLCALHKAMRAGHRVAVPIDALNEMLARTSI